MWKNEMDTETPAGLNEICKVFVVRYLVLVGFGMYNKFCMNIYGYLHYHNYL